MVLNNPFQYVFNFKVLTLASLYFVVVFCTLAVVYLKHFVRIKHADLQQLITEQQILIEEHGKLLLENSAFTADSRVERVAREVLGMQQPKQVEMIGP